MFRFVTLTRCLLAAGFTLFLFISLPAQDSRIQLSDMLRIRQAGSIDIHPSGKQVVFTVMSIEPESTSGEHGYRTHLWLAPTDGGSPARPLSSGNNSATEPRWSPDGRQLVFVRAAEGKPQLFLLSMDGGEAQQITRSPYGASNPRWSPDGKYILYHVSTTVTALYSDSILNAGKEAPDWPLEKPGFAENRFLTDAGVRANPDGSLDEVRAWLRSNEKDNKAKVINRLNFQQETTISPEILLTHLMITEARPDGTSRPLTRGFLQVSAAEWLNPSTLIFSGKYKPGQHIDRQLETGIYSLDIHTREIKTLAYETGHTLASPLPSPSGKWIAYTDGLTDFTRIPQVRVMPAPGNTGTIKKINYDRNISNLVWSEDERFLYFISPSNGGIYLNKADINNGQVQRLSHPDQGVYNFDVQGKQIVYTRTHIENPYEVYSSSNDLKENRVLTQLNSEWLRGKSLSVPEKYSFTNDAGQTIEYWVMKPIGFQTGKKYPLLLEIHGGPSAMWGPGEFSMWHEYQYFCSKGYGIVYSNPRGSGGYGESFVRSNINNWGEGPTRDVLTALDKTAAQGWADTSNLFVTGGSYAGYLVAWIVGHDHRFRAACAQRGVYDLSTFFGEGNAWRLVPYYFGGFPWENNTKQVIERESPINYVTQVRTPLIIFHGENDLRTGVIQSEMFYRSLKVLGKTVEYVRHPGASHEITRSGNNRQRMDQMLRTWEFFERFRTKGP